MGDLLVPAVSGALALVGVLVGGWLGSRKDKSQWVRDKQLSACARLNDEFSTLYNGLALSRRGEIPNLSWGGWNQALSAVSLVCDAVVVDAARGLDTELWRVDWSIRGGQATQADWIALRKPLEEARDLIVNRARIQLNPRQAEAGPVVGRPEDTDEMWKSRS